MAKLDMYKDTVDWYKISSNTDVMWTTDGINKFTNKINWENFSRYCPAYILTVDNLFCFKNKWNWTLLSNRKEIYSNWNLLDKVIDFVDWKEIIDSWDIKLPIQFFKRYENHIPMSYLQNSRFWDQMVGIMATQLKAEIVGLGLTD